MPSLIHQVESLEILPIADDANGVPLSERMMDGRPNSRKSLVMVFFVSARQGLRKP